MVNTVPTQKAPDRRFVFSGLNRANKLEEYTKPADIQIVENSAEMLYGLIHQRWIISPRGLQAMVCQALTPSNELRRINMNMRLLVIVHVCFAIRPL
jgi:Casein kinase II regulatory subunit